MKANVIHDRLTSLLAYDPATGIFTWKVTRGRDLTGKSAGYLMGRGYVTIRIDGKDYRAHRLAWFYATGEWPSGEIDHRDLNKANNALGNLRVATRAQNAANTPAHRSNRSGFKGVSKSRGRYRARICRHGQSVSLGFFETPEDAAESYAAAAIAASGDFARSA